MKHIINTYKNAFETFGDTPQSVLWPKGRQDDRFEALTKNIKKNNFSILDFGCGLAHLKPYLNGKFTNFTYIGADIVSDFIQNNKQKYQQNEFLQIQNVQDIHKNYDYIVSSGVFNILYVEDIIAHKKIVFDTLEYLFEHTNIYLSVNFMRDEVDFIQKTSYHQNISEIYEFVIKNLSKRVMIDTSYMPYEYTITIFKQQEITRPDNTYTQNV